jgi:hypothetical protein
LNALISASAAVEPAHGTTQHGDPDAFHPSGRYRQWHAHGDV